MEAIAKEVERVIKKAPVVIGSTRPGAPVAPTSIPGALDALLASLETIRSNVEASSDEVSPAVLAQELSSLIGGASKTAAAAQKEFYNALSKYGKALDKKFPTPIDGVADPGLFTSKAAQRALEGTVREHLLRCGEWDAARLLSEEAGLGQTPASNAATFQQLKRILDRIHSGDLEPAIRWASENASFLSLRRSNLEFALRRSEFLRIALGMSMSMGDDDDDDDDNDDVRTDEWANAREDIGESMVLDGASSRASLPGLRPSTTQHQQQGSNVERALLYGREHFAPFVGTMLPEIQRLFSLLLFLPSDDYEDGDDDAAMGLSHSMMTLQVPAPYRIFLDAQAMHSPLLLPMFEVEYCARYGMARNPPLQVAVEIGAGGALNRIIKVRSLMKQRGNEWSQADELPVEIPLPHHLRFHSAFACPVSKEQGTEENPPMMMLCGHVVCFESLARLGKANGRVKCPYCPVESTVKQASRVYF